VKKGDFREVGYTPGMPAKEKAERKRSGGT